MAGAATTYPRFETVGIDGPVGRFSGTGRGVALSAVLLMGIFSSAVPLPALASPGTVAALAGAPASSVSSNDVQAVKSTLQRQFDAFARDDAAAAFALASTGIRTQFGDADKFMTVVRKQYQAVYRHRIALFAETERVDGAVMQTVRLTDANDRVWLALYRLEREADGQWHIVGCQLLETKSVST